jgi:cell division protease FtsH
MGSLGPVAFESDDQQPFLGYEMSQGRDYSEATAARIDDDVQKLMAERCEIVTGLLNGAGTSWISWRKHYSVKKPLTSRF